MQFLTKYSMKFRSLRTMKSTLTDECALPSFAEIRISLRNSSLLKLNLREQFGGLKLKLNEYRGLLCIFATGWGTCLWNIEKEDKSEGRHAGGLNPSHQAGKLYHPSNLSPSLVWSLPLFPFVLSLTNPLRCHPLTALYHSSHCHQTLEMDLGIWLIMIVTPEKSAEYCGL